VKVSEDAKVTEPSRCLGTYQSRGIWSGGQGTEEGICGALEVAEFASAILGPKNVSVKGVATEDAVTGR